MKKTKYAIIGVTLFQTTLISLISKELIGWDIKFHLVPAREWAIGKLGMFSEFVLNINHMPYPPVFHWLLVPSIWLGIEDLFIRLLQVIFLPLIVLLVMNLVNKHMGETKAAICGGLLISSLAFFDRLLQAIPQTLDILLYPLCVDAYLSDDKKIFVLFSTLMVWNHGIVAGGFIGGLLIFALLRGRWKEVASIGILSLPIIITTIPYFLDGILHNTYVLSNAQKRLFLSNPITYMVIYMGAMLIGWPFLAYSLKHHISKSGQNQGSDLEKIAILTVFSLLTMFPSWPVRFLEYVALPLAIITTSKLKLRWYKAIFGLILFGYALSWFLFLQIL